MLTVDNLHKIYVYAPMDKLNLFLDPLNVALTHYDISTRLRAAAFLAQVGHESGELNYVEEIASGAAYEGRKDLGNTSPGDGELYKGRGLIQITGKRNYAIASIDMDLPLLEHPELLCTPMNAAMSAGWYWNNNKLNALADTSQFLLITKVINGGTNGIANRQRLYTKALEVLK